MTDMIDRTDMTKHTEQLVVLETELVLKQQEVWDLRGRVKAERLRLMEVAFGVKPGAIVRTTDGTQYRVAEIDVNILSVRSIEAGEKPWLTVNPRNKDGKFGRREKRLYGGNWTVVKSQEEDGA